MNLKELKEHTKEWRERYTTHKETYPDSYRDIFPDEAYCCLIDNLIEVVEAAKEIVEILDDSTSRKEIDSFTSQPLKIALQNLEEDNKDDDKKAKDTN